MKGTKENNYDTTVNQRMKKREDRIRRAGLSNLKVVMHKDDASEVRNFAKELYERRGLKLD